ncbi:MAG: hypothetical protein LBV04_07515 [Deferribacteraceae bacterium]|jgi:hypothetical protein|nr:hypothetical protein [Deferribacteraceae bacterium]
MTLDDLLAELAETPSGQQIPLLEEAIHLADQLGDRKQSFTLRKRLINKAVAHGESLKALPAFSWCFAETKKPDSEFDTKDLLPEYSKIIDHLSYDPNISSAKMEDVFTNFKEELLAAGYSLRSYYTARLYYHWIHDEAEGALDLAKEAYQEFQKHPRDRICDCAGDEQRNLSNYAIRLYNDYTLAKALAEPILDGSLCANQSCSCSSNGETVRLGVISDLLPAAYKNGDLEFAAHLEQRGYPLLIKKHYISEEGAFLRYYAYTDPDRALKEYVKFIPKFFNKYNISSCSYFSQEVGRMFGTLIKYGHTTARLKLPAEHPLHNNTGEYSLQALQEYHEKFAIDYFGEDDSNADYDEFEDKKGDFHEIQNNITKA